MVHDFRTRSWDICGCSRRRARRDWVQYVTWPKEATMPSLTPPEPRRSHDDLADLVEDVGFALMLFAGATIALTILVLILVL
jgi:hypothetical protein